MKWQEVRTAYPDQFVKMQILNFHIRDNKKYIDEVAVIKPLRDGKEATSELVHSQNDTIVYHTKNKELIIEIRNITGLRGIIQ